jgi:sugar lactone lactonase YvrE
MANWRAHLSNERSPVVFGLLMLAALGGCGAKNSPAGGLGGAPGGLGGATGATCAVGTATGTLSVRITGTPSGAGDVAITGGVTLTTSTDVTLAAGPQTLTAYLVAAGSNMVRDAYTPDVDLPTPCVRAGQITTVNVRYTRIATSGALWVGASQTPSGASLLSYEPAVLDSSGASMATVAAATHGSAGFTFDIFGNAWVVGDTSADPPVARYPAASLATDGAKTADIVINSPAFAGGVPGPSVVAFDSDGNLWVSVVFGNKVVKIAAAQLTLGTHAPAAAVEEGGINGPAGIAFDLSGNLWVASTGDSTIMRINAAHLTTSGTGADLTITALTPSPVIGTLSTPLGIAFDATGNLWVNYDGRMVRLTPADLAGTGTKTITPSVQIVVDVLSLPEGVAFDEFGGLWFADRMGHFACLGASQLTASSSQAPQIIISSPDLGYAGWIALYPAPAFTPLAHALP